MNSFSRYFLSKIKWFSSGIAKPLALETSQIVPSTSANISQGYFGTMYIGSQRQPLKFKFEIDSSDVSVQGTF